MGLLTNTLMDLTLIQPHPFADIVPKTAYGKPHREAIDADVCRTDTNKIGVLDEAVAAQAIRRAMTSRSPTSICYRSFIGSNWHRKARRPLPTRNIWRATTNITRRGRVSCAACAALSRRPDSALARFRGKLQRRFARHDDANFVPAPWPGFHIDPAAQAVGDDVVDDVQSQAGVALVATGREKRVEHLAPDFRAHAAAVV